MSEERQGPHKVAVGDRSALGSCNACTSHTYHKVAEFELRRFRLRLCLECQRKFKRILGQ